MEIKKAWDRMKREVRKELGISGGFSMTARQIKNRTATYCICNVFPYDKEIADRLDSIAMVNAYDTWTDAEKKHHEEYNLTAIAGYEAMKQKYGTKENEMAQVTKAILNSKAFAKFQQEVGQVTVSNEQMDICYYIRFNY